MKLRRSRCFSQVVGLIATDFHNISDICKHWLGFLSEINVIFL